MEGPKAPRDPEAKGSGFYIMRGKQIAGNPQPDGRGIQFIYLNDVRLVTFAKMVGNIEDEELLSLLKTAKGFRTLVEAVGVTVEMREQDQKVDFVLQMYGKKDPNHSGTLVCETVVADGMEHRICLDDYEWSDDDNVPGQIRFEFQQAGALAEVDVKLYVRGGFRVPEPEELFPVDETSPEYREMIRRSLIQTGNSQRLRKVIGKARRGEEVTLAFIGGSITQGAGAIPIHTSCYPYLTVQDFSRKYSGKEAGFQAGVRLIKAGVGGTPSELGIVRFERDVLREGSVEPDLVVVEFAVNDEGDETRGECYESLVRRILALPNQPAVILLFAVFANDWNLQDRLIPIGKAYGLPLVSMKNAVSQQFKLEQGKGRVLSKSQYFYDSYHPSNMGHRIMADCLLYLMEQAEAGVQKPDGAEASVQKPAGAEAYAQEPAGAEPYAQEPAGAKLCIQKSEDAKSCGQEPDWESRTPVYGAAFQNIRLRDRRTNTQTGMVECGSFSETDTCLQAVEMDDSFTPQKEFPFNWMHREGTEPFRMRITCKALVLVYKDSGEAVAGRAVVYVDGKQALKADPHINGWIHCNPLIILREDESREHLVEIRMDEGEEQKEFTILGFGVVD